MGISASLSAIYCPECGTLIVVMTCEEDGLLVGNCGGCGAKVEKRKGEPAKVVKPS